MTEKDEEFLKEAQDLALKMIRTIRRSEEKRAKEKHQRIEFGSFDTGDEILQKIRKLSGSDAVYRETIQKIMNRLIAQSRVTFFGEMKVYSKDSMQLQDSKECYVREIKENNFSEEIDLGDKKIIIDCYLHVKTNKDGLI